MMRYRIGGILAVMLVAVALRVHAQGYEVPPEQSAALALPASEQRGLEFEVLDPVRADGLMYHYELTSRFGHFTAYGEAALRDREQELRALARAARITDVEVFVRAVGREVQAQTKTVTTVLTHPVGVVTGIPRGIAHLFSGYSAQARELGAEAGAIKGGPSQVDLQRQAVHYADRFLGLTAAERRWYEQLHVDPYTDNEVLRRTVRHLARVDAGAQLALKFASVPGIPYEGYVDRALQAIYHEDPEVLRARQRKTLASYGLTTTEIKQFENTLLLTPTRQQQIEQAARALEGVAGRAELFRHAMSVTSPEELALFVQGLELLVALQPSHPITRIVEGIRMPTGESADGHLHAYGAFDAVYWTADIDGYERTAHALLPKNAPIELWVSGSVSAQAQHELAARGWQVHDRAPTAAPTAAR